MMQEYRYDSNGSQAIDIWPVNFSLQIHIQKPSLIQIPEGRKTVSRGGATGAGALPPILTQ
jgi:hypothetical protein